MSDVIRGKHEPKSGQNNSNHLNGITKIEAVSLTFARKELILIYFCIFLIFFVISLQQQIQFNVVSYVTSSFVLLPLTGTTSIISSVVAGVLRLPTGKFVDIVGRSEGFIIMTAFTTIGLVMMAATRNVQTFAAAQVFYWVGFDGMAYVMDVLMADTSNLENRALIFAFSTTPYIITTFIGPHIASIYLRTSGWPWAYGTFAIITPVITLPLLYTMGQSERKARRTGILSQSKGTRTITQSMKYYFIEFDVPGLILICAGFSLVLLTFSLKSYQAEGWDSVVIITMITVGIICLIGFAVWEKYVAPVTFLPVTLFRDPSILGACVLMNLLFISFYLWDSNFLPFLQVVHGLSIRDAGYINNIYSIGSCFWAVIFAGLIRVTGRFKYLSIIHLCLQIIGVGLMIHFRQPFFNLAYVVMCQILISFGGGGLVISAQMAVMAACPRKTFAIPLALLALFSSIGGAIGTAISGAIFTKKFPQVLKNELPGNQTLNDLLYGSVSTQLSYPFGTPEREAVLKAYGEAMWYQTIVATVVLVPCFFFILIWKDFKTQKTQINENNNELA
ncbi:MFS siderochrome iron transporter 1 [Podosphaera aphanis]|nr:MFS siderochrome iron transporter 1 [Podosphaera aphanis]